MLRRDVIGMDVVRGSDGQMYEAPILSQYLRVVIWGVPLPAGWFVNVWRRFVIWRRVYHV